MNRIRWYGPSLVLLIAVLATLWLGPIAVDQISHAQDAAQIRLAANRLVENPALADLSSAYRDVAVRVEPSVVHIEVLGRERPQRIMIDPFEGTPFEGTPFDERFRQRIDPRPQPQEDSPFDRFDPLPAEGNGSGWVYDDEGHIITNRHVVANAQGLRVTFFDGGKYEAEVVGTDELTDVAVLKVKAGKLHRASVAAEPVQPGDIVFAFGSPLGFDFSISQGIVSAKGRDLGILRRVGGYENFIQTDAAINPGNSGGPLTNIYGQVVGMNSAIASRSGGWMGIGFAIPADMVTHIADQLIAEGAFNRGQLGIYFSNEGPLTRAMAESFGFDGQGVLVNDVMPESGAAEAGVQPGDIITAVNDQPVSSGRELRRYIGTFTRGTTLKITVFRASEAGGETLDFGVKLAPMPGEAQAEVIERGMDAPDAEEPEIDPDTQQQSEALQMLRNFGIEGMDNFSERDARAAGVTHKPGVLITEVRRGSLANPDPRVQPGLRPGMLITRVSDADVTTTDELLTELAKYDASEGVRARVAVWDGRDNRWIERFWLIRVPE